MPYEPFNKEDTNTFPSDGETLSGYSQRIRRKNTQTRNQYQAVHQRVHYCCYGAHSCYICPMWDTIDFISDSGIEIAQLLAKVKKTAIWSQKDPTAIGKWTIKRY